MRQRVTIGGGRAWEAGAGAAGVGVAGDGPPVEDTVARLCSGVLLGRAFSGGSLHMRLVY